MTIIAGIYSIKRNEIQNELRTELQNAFKDHVKANDLIRIFSDKNSHIITFDIGAYGDSGISEDPAVLTILTGDPLIRPSTTESRSCQASLINKAFKSGKQTQVLELARGIFSGVTVNKIDGTCTLFTDKQGIRPIYYYQKDDLVVFSSQLNFLMNLSFIDFVHDKKGVAEQISFGFCLSNRTTYKYIKRLDPAEILEINKIGLSISRYWDWTKIENKSTVCEQDTRKLYDAFVDAIKIRLNGEQNAIAFLSGGLDSRCITSVLKLNVESLYTVNFGTFNSQDRVFARKFAERAGTIHHEKTLPELSFPNWSQLISDEINSIQSIKAKPFNTRMIWSGDGGSVGMGAVYITKPLIETIYSGDKLKAAKQFLQSCNSALPKNFLSKKTAISLDGEIEDSIASELIINPNDPGKAAYYFLMNNDQKRHLNTHFETIHEHKKEFYLPFFDSNFLEVVHTFPIETMIYHNLYMRWFEHFPKFTKSTPWQTYPRHEACPLKIEDSLSYQWEKNPRHVKHRLNDSKEALVLLFSNVSGLKYGNRINSLIAVCLHALNIRDYSYVINMLKRLSSIK